jgi:peptidyl-dipeptidase A
MKIFHLGILLSVSTIITIATLSASLTDEAKLGEFISAHVQTITPLNKAAALADWNANASGEKKYYDQSASLQLQINKIYSNKKDFAFLKDLKDRNAISDSLLKRQLTVLYDDYITNQIDSSLQKTIIHKQSALEERFNTFRGKIGSKSYNDNELYGILKTDTNSDRRKRAWEASKQVGQEVAGQIIELAKLRNQAAREMGFENYYQMVLKTDEQDPEAVSKVLEQLKQTTDEPFRLAKQELDSAIAKRMNIRNEEIRPWHYANPFFQEVSELGDVNLDKLYKDKDVVKIAETFYATIDLQVDDILKNSDLYPRAGKYQHAFCADIDKQGDIRAMCNITPSQEWMGTILHELGHGIYDKYINRNLPYLLRGSSHSFTTEAIAELMGRQAANVDWLINMGILNRTDADTYRKALDKNLRFSQLAFCRWSLVMEYFERGLYENPDQDLNKLWWDLVEKYQLVKRPENRNEPDWAAKIHIALYPCYYHNYILGEMTASQILNTIVCQVEKKNTLTEISFANHPEIGVYLEEKIFFPGASLQWNDLLKYATGEGLSAQYFAEEFVGK